MIFSKALIEGEAGARQMQANHFLEFLKKCEIEADHSTEKK